MFSLKNHELVKSKKSLHPANKQTSYAKASDERILGSGKKELALKLAKEYAVVLAETARQSGVSTPGIAQKLKRDRFV